MKKFLKKITNKSNATQTDQVLEDLDNTTSTSSEQTEEQNHSSVKTAKQRLINLRKQRQQESLFTEQKQTEPEESEDKESTPALQTYVREVEDTESEETAKKSKKLLRKLGLKNKPKPEKIALEISLDDIQPKKQPFWSFLVKQSRWVYWTTFVLLILQGLLVVNQVFLYRTEYQTFNRLKKESKDLDIEWGKMLIEKQTFGSTGQIATRSTQQLGMFSPNGQQRIVMTLPNNEK